MELTVFFWGLFMLLGLRVLAAAVRIIVEFFKTK